MDYGLKCDEKRKCVMILRKLIATYIDMLSFPVTLTNLAVDPKETSLANTGVAFRLVRDASAVVCAWV